jgi:hypothetical protein
LVTETRQPIFLSHSGEDHELAVRFGRDLHRELCNWLGLDKVEAFNTSEDEYRFSEGLPDRILATELTRKILHSVAYVRRPSRPRRRHWQRAWYHTHLLHVSVVRPGCRHARQGSRESEA